MQILFIIGNPVYSQTTPSDKIEYSYLANKEKVFDESVDEFYLALRDIKYLYIRSFIKDISKSQRTAMTFGYYSF